MHKIMDNSGIILCNIVGLASWFFGCLCATFDYATTSIFWAYFGLACLTFSVDCFLIAIVMISLQIYKLYKECEEDEYGKDDNHD